MCKTGSWWYKLCIFSHITLLTVSWKSGAFLCTSKAQSCPTSSENHVKSLGYSKLSLCNNTVKYNHTTVWLHLSDHYREKQPGHFTTTWVILTHPERAGNSVWTRNSICFMVLLHKRFRILLLPALTTMSGHRHWGIFQSDLCTTASQRPLTEREECFPTWSVA